MILRITLMIAMVSTLSIVADAQEGAPGAGSVRVQLDTTEGAIVLELDAAKAPKTVANFLEYVKDGHYKGTIFHRVIDGFMIQGGGFDESMKEKSTKPPVRNEGGNGLNNDKYTVAMARTSNPHSATSQFFVNTAKNDFLNRSMAQDGFGYTVFGKVVEGNDVIDRIGKTPTKSTPNPAMPAMLMDDVPVNPIVIKDVKVLAAKK